jgi:hypothetical protein
MRLNPFPYNVEVESIRASREYFRWTSYGNLNKDPGMEEYGFANSQGGNCNLLVFKGKNDVLDQWNFKGSINYTCTGNFTGDYDHDGDAEIAAFSLDDRNILLNVVEPFDSLRHLVMNLRIDTLWESQLKPFLIIQDVKFHDLNSDGYDEIVFSLNPWYALQPRSVYAYDIRNSRLFKTPVTGFGMGELTILDYDRDGHPEIFSLSSASNNYPSGGIPYPDTAGYFYVLDHELNFKVFPEVVSPRFSNSQPFLIPAGSDTMVYFICSVPGDSINPVKCLKVARDLKISKEQPDEEIISHLPDYVEVFYSRNLSFPFNSRDRVIVAFSGKGHEFTMDMEDYFTLVKMHNPEAGLGKCEFVTNSQSRNNLIYFWNFRGKRLARLELDLPIEFFDLDWIGKAERGYRFLMGSGNMEYQLIIFKNPFYYLQFLILMSLIAGFYGLIVAIRAIQSSQIASRENMRREILELQLKSVRNQLDPHFTFNALNTLSGLSLTGDQRGVDHFIGHFSRLLRTHLQTADKILIPLRDEIEFVTNYVELQRIRFENQFQLILEIPASIDLAVQVPRMMVQTHVENALKHGLVTGQEGKRAGRQEGKIWVRVKEEEKNLVIEVEDNGAGRGNSPANSYESTGKGLSNQDKIFNSLWQLYGIRISSSIIDLHRPDGSPGGTRIRIMVQDSL